MFSSSMELVFPKKSIPSTKLEPIDEIMKIVGEHESTGETIVLEKVSVLLLTLPLYIITLL